MPRTSSRNQLDRYRGKRSPDATNEPFGDESPAAMEQTLHGAYVIHLHDATRKHYDVRLELGGVLLSFAVPHGPSLDPTKKSLAVRTEEHPIEYLEFEDVIPDGQYGAGPMIAWDRGQLTYVEGPAEEELRSGKLHIELRGMKLRGRWAFVKLAKGETGNEWLLFKKQDEYADPSRDILEELPRSVFSGLRIDELERRDAIAEEHVARARDLGGVARAGLAAELARAPSPLTSIEGGRPGKRVLYDAQLDGVRVLAVRDEDVVALRAFTGGRAANIEAFYPDVVRALRALPVGRVAFDGELVAFDASGRPSLPLLAQRVGRIGKGEVHRAVTTTPVVLVVQDVLAIDDIDTRSLPVEKRRALVTELLPSLGYLRAASPLDGDERHILATCAALGIGAVIAKAKGSKYDAAWTRLETGAPKRPSSIVDHRVDIQTTLRQVKVTNREKIFWPLEGYTKGDLVDYYAAVADVLCPYLKERPVILVRYPDGIDGKNFFQWRVPAGMPPWVRTMTISSELDAAFGEEGPHAKVYRPRKDPTVQKAPKRSFLVDDASTLIYIANLGCIPLHVLAGRAPDLTWADYLTLDFDVKQSELRHAITLAQSVHEILDRLGLEGFPKTSGQSGLHVLVPLGPKQSFDTARALAELLGRLLVDRHPDIATMERNVSKRGPRVYVDTGQTGTGRAIVAPYSVRAVPGATVSTPLAWNEVGPSLDPRAFTIKTVPQRIQKRGDLLKGLLEARPDVVGAVDKLAGLMKRPP